MTLQPITALGNRSTRRYWIGSDRRHDRYNRSLVNRIEDLMDPSFFMDWKPLLEENNRGKRGHPYVTPNAFITFPARLRSVYGIPFRSLEGIARIFARITEIRSVCYTSIFRRIRKIVPFLPHNGGKQAGIPSYCIYSIHRVTGSCRLPKPEKLTLSSPLFITTYSHWMRIFKVKTVLLYCRKVVIILLQLKMFFICPDYVIYVLSEYS